ncbi:MAG TPA: MYXO-CTERM sorting domain-containing protein [Polyangiaceae bacterium]|jgi:MYXO-CTERM domain-containing protein
MKPKITRLFASAAAALAVLAASHPATAQVTTITLEAPNIVHSDQGTRPSMPLKYINRADCLQDDVISFPLVFGGGNDLGLTLEAWAGVGCDQAAARTSSTNTACWLVYRDIVASPTINIALHVRDVLAGTAANGLGNVTTGTVIADTPVSICEPSSAAAPPTNLTLYFLLVSSGEMAAATTSWAASFKLSGPPAPTSLTGQTGAGELIVDFDPTSSVEDPSLSGFAAFCDPAPGAATDAAEAGAPRLGCPGSNIVVPGQDPPASDLCGQATKAAVSITATGLTDGANYDVGVAAVDTYFNTGPLSETACGVPGTSTDVRVKSGCGLCSFARPQSTRVPSALAALLGLALFARRRRRFASC